MYYFAIGATENNWKNSISATARSIPYHTAAMFDVAQSQM